MTKVILHGDLGVAVGRKEWFLEVASPAEALRAIEANTQKLFKFLRDTGEGYALYRVLVDNQDVADNVDELTIPVRHDRVFEFLPVPQGAENGGIWTAIAGVALIVVGALLAWAGGYSLSFAGVSILAGTGAGTAAGAAALSLVFTAGIALTLGGIAQMLSPVTKNNESPEDSANRPSHLFNGALNTVRQGNPIAIGFGEVICGSQLISSGLTTTDLPTLTLWSSTTVYVKGAEVQYNSRYYSSKVNDNVGRTPPTYPTMEDTYWEDVTDE